MKILVLTNNCVGLYSFRKEVVSTLLEAGNEVVVSAPLDERAKDVEQLGCRIIATPFNRKGMNPFKDIALMLRYRKLLNSVHPDVVLSYTIKPNLYGGMACQLVGVPQIANITGLGSAVETPGLLQKLTIFLYKVGLKNANTVFFQNKANKDFFLNHRMLKGNWALIPGSGVNLNYHKFSAYPTDDIVKFIFISRLLKEKGIEEYLSAASIVKERYHNVEFHILGACEQNYKEKLKQLQSSGVVIYHGRQPDVRPFISSTHCTIHPSYYPEGMSNVLLESCAAGRPVITTDRPGCGEIVNNNITGFLVKPKDVDNLVSVIERFLKLPYEQKKQMGINARKKVEKEFDRRIVIDAYLNAINIL